MELGKGICGRSLTHGPLLLLAVPTHTNTHTNIHTHIHTHACTQVDDHGPASPSAGGGGGGDDDDADMEMDGGGKGAGGGGGGTVRLCACNAGIIERCVSYIYVYIYVCVCLRVCVLTCVCVYFKNGKWTHDIAPTTTTTTTTNHNPYRVNKLVTVQPPKSRYQGAIGDLVVGRITEVAAKRWKVDVRGHKVLT
jgi:hypothetical protein